MKILVYTPWISHHIINRCVWSCFSVCVVCTFPVVYVRFSAVCCTRKLAVWKLVSIKDAYVWYYFCGIACASMENGKVSQQKWCTVSNIQSFQCDLKISEISVKYGHEPMHSFWRAFNILGEKHTHTHSRKLAQILSEFVNISFTSWWFSFISLETLMFLCKLSPQIDWTIAFKQAFSFAIQMI